MRALNNIEVGLVSGGHTTSTGNAHEDRSFWYRVGVFFAAQANANDAIYKQYGNTNRNHM
jgi:hypothetical protein